MEGNKELMRQLLSSELRGDLLALFRKNPGLMDTMDGVARRLGVQAEAIEADAKGLAGLGVLRIKQLGKFQVISIDEERDGEVQNAVAAYLSSLKPVSR